MLDFLILTQPYANPQTIATIVNLNSYDKLNAISITDDRLKVSVNHTEALTTVQQPVLLIPSVEENMDLESFNIETTESAMDVSSIESADLPSDHAPVLLHSSKSADKTTMLLQPSTAETISMPNTNFTDKTVQHSSAIVF